MFRHSSSAEHPILDFTHGFDQGNELFFGGRVGGHKNGLWCYSVNGYRAGKNTHSGRWVPFSLTYFEILQESQSYFQNLKDPPTFPKLSQTFSETIVKSQSTGLTDGLKKTDYGVTVTR